MVGKCRKNKLFPEWSEEPLIGKTSLLNTDKTLTKFNFGKKEENVCMAYSVMYWETIRAGIQAVSQRLKLKQRMLVTGLLFMARSVLFLIHPMTIWTGMARSKIILSPTTIINKEKATDICPQVNLMQAIPQLSFLLPRCLCCIKLLKN